MHNINFSFGIFTGHIKLSVKWMSERECYPSRLTVLCAWNCMQLNIYAAHKIAIEALFLIALDLVPRTQCMLGSCATFWLFFACIPHNCPIIAWFTHHYAYYVYIFHIIIPHINSGILWLILNWSFAHMNWTLKILCTTQICVMKLCSTWM